ncbi:MAG: phospho-N-acetylmuramoyl-pentapeptide-transferase, partial [Flavobacteriaceae bacterium]|nr:phospho-N-acetylmuramoyl-pentapeptide-transferase [Flavobacteriaceae bacterium]
MLYYLFQFLEDKYQFPGAQLFEYLSFRSAMAILLSLLISTIYGKRIINYLQTKQIGESVRELGLQGQSEKAGTPTMGGIIIIISTLIPVLLLAKLENIYVILLIITTLWMGAIGFLDDYIKTFKKDKEGLPGKFKIIGQIGLGLIVGCIMYFNDGITVKEKANPKEVISQEMMLGSEKLPEMGPEEKTLTTTIPFVKNNEFD